LVFITEVQCVQKVTVYLGYGM